VERFGTRVESVVLSTKKGKIILGMIVFAYNSMVCKRSSTEPERQAKQWYMLHSPGITEMPKAGRMVSVLLVRPGNQMIAGFHPVVVTLSPDLLAVQSLPKQCGLIDIHAW